MIRVIIRQGADIEDRGAYSYASHKERNHFTVSPRAEIQTDAHYGHQVTELLV